MLIGVDFFADGYLVLTMIVNVVATSLIAYKAWYVLQIAYRKATCLIGLIVCREHRRILKNYVGTGGSKTRTLKALALLVESGMIYCALLVRVAAVTNVLGSRVIADIPRGVPIQEAS